jgi:ECF transporter S component (folate family)
METKTKNNNTRRDYIRRITMNAMMIAMYVVLDGVSLKLNDYMKLTFNSFAVIICIILFGMLDGCIVAGVGEFIIQLKFISPFLPLFVLVQLVRAFIMGIFAEALFAKKKYLEKKPVWLYAMCIVSGLVTSALNSVVLFAYLSGMDYANLFRVPAAYWLTRIPAFSSTFVTSAVLATAAIPVARALRRIGMGRKIVLDEVKE